MAGDWIKMRIALADDPAVISIAARLSVDEFTVVGMLHHLWGWADTQSRDGHAPGVTNVWIDRYIRHAGFAEAVISVGWLEIDESGVTFPNFDRHNGETAKTRALAAERKRNQRNKVTEEEGHMSRSQRDISVTREEKRREEPNSSSTKKNSAPRFDSVAYLLSFGVDEKTIMDWLEVRRSKKLKATQTAMEGVVDEARKAGVSVQKAIEMCCKRGWGGFDSSWMPKTNSPPGWHDQNAETIAALTGRSRDHEPDNRTIDM